jgi:glucose/arabinose dehydrogenase
MKLTLFIALILSFASQATQLKEVVTDLEQPVDIKFFPKSNNQLLVAGKTGQLTYTNLLTNNHYLVHKFSVKSGSEMGLLGLAFHPSYADNQFIFVNYFPKKGERQTRISRFSLLKSAETYQLSNEKVILEIDQPYRNHNGGQIAFGPDGYLYIGMGDGGSGGDPKGHGQNTKTLLGNMLRIDINTPDNIPYAIPQNNPFIKHANFKPEIWAYGLRNPWRFSFNNEDLIAADVGQHKYEEISIIKKGQNMGWNIMEATHCFKPKYNCDTQGLSQPRFEYGRDKGQSITGGYVYKGSLNTNLKGKYIFGDFVSGNIWSVNYPEFTSPINILSKQGNLSTFAIDSQGEIYVAEYGKGIVYQIVP